MNGKEVRISYNYTRGEFLMQEFHDGVLFDWKVFDYSVDLLAKGISPVFFPDRKGEKV